MKVTLNDAHILAKQIREKSSKVKGIDLFGSVLRNGIGHDVDLMLLVEDEIAREFWNSISMPRRVGGERWLKFRRIVKKILPSVDDFFIHTKKKARQEIVSKLIGLNLALLGENYRPGTVIEVWMLPLDWRVDKELNKSAMLRVANLENSMLLFLERIASTAKKIQ